MDPSLKGARREAETKGIAMDIGMGVELARLTQQLVMGIQYGYSKRCDHLVREVIFPLLTALGLPDGIRRALEGFYVGLRRAFKIAGTHRDPFHDSNSGLQGCALTQMMLNVLVTVLAKAIRHRCDGCKPSAYVDDRGLRHGDPRKLYAGVQETTKFDRLTGQVQNLAKAEAWATTDEGMQQLRDQWIADPDHPEGRRRVATVVESFKPLGAQQTPRGPKRLTLQHERAERLIGMAERIEDLPHPAEQKAKVLAAVARAAGIFGCEQGGFLKTDEDDMRRAVLQALWGSERQRKCVEIVFAVLFQGHLLEPRMAVQ